ncbi:unnamed protein product [Rotaria socialis]|uniref:Uncharacterized protein n=1 Tax=Rotaria socialis TaxID=392032 RepID=A0A819V3V1_9BILA|nr:unnamed protein product [Rotaria socialis]
MGKYTIYWCISSSDVLDLWSANLTWPDATFIPHAVDVTKNFGVISGFIYNGMNSTVKYSPMIYLFNFNSSNERPIVVNEYKPITTPGTWQDLLTNDNANFYSAEYDMSVSINQYGDVLVGMPFINRVLLFSVNISKPTQLYFVSRNTNGRALGNGKSIAWLNNGIAALVVNVYTLDYDWLTSQIQVYDIRTFGYNSNSTPLLIFPNNHEKIPKSLDPVFINIVSSPSSLALLDNSGHILIFLPTLPGFYLTVKDTGTMPLITTSRACIPGTFKNQSGIHDCTLCPSGMKNPGNFTTFCIPCSSDSFCPLGSVNDVPQSALENVIQAVPYPKSPESVVFEEILIKNMFLIGSNRCVVISPLFWTLIVGTLAVGVLIIMGISKYIIKDPRKKRTRELIKKIFRHTDLFGEGELWVGGLASFSAITLVCFAYAFSSHFMRQYPIETSSDSYFACDTTIRNAKFQTGLQSLAIPFSKPDQQMFDLLDNQTLILNVDFVNTFIKCDAISIDALLDLVWSTIRWLNCDNINSTLSLSVQLPYQHVSIQVNIADAKIIGALRIGLYGDKHESENYVLKQLKFYQSFFKNGSILARNLPVAVSLTKVINETLSIDGGESIFSGIFIPTFTVDHNSLFFTEDQFARSTLTVTTLNIAISETLYYVKNLQEPIAKSSEIIFQNLLFTTVCLELFGLIFLLFRLLLKPMYYCIRRKTPTHNQTHVDNKEQNCAHSLNDKTSGTTYVDMSHTAYL